MKIRALAIGAAALCLPFGLVACGGDDDNNSGSRPSVSEITKAVEEQGGSALPDGVAKCIAEKLHESDIPNGVLRAVAAGEEAEVDKGNEDKYTKIVTDSATECATAAVGQ